jgi:predicted Zn-dependent peptidase
MRKIRYLKEISFISAIAIIWLSSVPSASPGQSWTPAAQKKVLENGLTVILEKDTSSATTFLEILIKGGKRAEPLGKMGLAFMATRLAVEIPDSDQVQELMRLASRFSVASRGDYSLINIECLSSNAEATLKILSRIILDPLFSGLRMDVVKKYMQHQGKIEQDDSVIVGHLADLHAFFGQAGYGGSIYGEEKSLEAIKSRDVKDFYNTYFVAPNMIFSGSSDLPEDLFLRMIEKYFASVPRGKLVSLGSLSFISPEEKKRCIERDTKQTLVSLAFPLPKITPRSFALDYLLENLLGKGPGSRLWPLRTEERLAYNVNCRLTEMQEGGILEAYLETDNKKRDRALEALKNSLADLSKKGITAEELQVTKTIGKANFLRDNEPKEMRAARLASFEALGLGFGYFAELMTLIDALTLEEVNDSLKDILNPDKAFEVVVGPKQEIQ